MRRRGKVAVLEIECGNIKSSRSLAGTESKTEKVPNLKIIAECADREMIPLQTRSWLETQITCL
jgi:hypothetical protein